MSLNKFFTRLFLLILLILTAGYILLNKTTIPLTVNELLILTGCFSAISALSFLVFYRGRNKEPDNQTMHFFVAVSLKLPLELILVLLWFFVAKKTSPSSLILFFFLYLTFSLFLVIFILKALKNKSL